MVPNCSSRSPDHFDVPIHGSTMKIADARAIIVGAVDPQLTTCDFSRYLSLNVKKTDFAIWPCSCDFNSELALVQPCYNQLASPLDM